MAIALQFMPIASHSCPFLQRKQFTFTHTVKVNTIRNNHPVLYLYTLQVY